MKNDRSAFWDDGGERPPQGLEQAHDVRPTPHVSGITTVQQAEPGRSTKRFHNFGSTVANAKSLWPLT
jgi:hypothetical protein